MGLIIGGISFICMAEVQGVKHGKDERFRQPWAGSPSPWFPGPGLCWERGQQEPALAGTSSGAPVLWSPLLLRAGLVSRQQPHGLAPTVLPLAAASVTTVTN